MPRKKTPPKQEGEFRKVRTPREGEILGVVVKMMGYDRLQVRNTDGKTRLCRIRGKMKKRVWIRENDIVLVAPWDFQDERGDIVWRYSRGQARWLEEKGYLQGI